MQATDQKLMKFTVFGGSGFIGSHLVRSLKESGVPVFSPPRSQPLFKGQDLGHVIYCAGLNGSLAATNSHEMIEAHVNFLSNVLKNFRYQSFLYLSSARVYAGSKSTEEESSLLVNPLKSSDFYAISKIAGESICFATARPSVRIVRLSNVCGGNFTSSNFLPAILRDAVTKKRVLLESALDSEKDYVNIKDVVRLLPRVAESGRRRIYNIAGGFNVSHQAITSKLKELTGCRVEVQSGAPKTGYPAVNIERIRQEFDFSPVSILNDLEDLVRQFEHALIQQPSMRR